MKKLILAGFVGLLLATTSYAATYQFVLRAPGVRAAAPAGCNAAPQVYSYTGADVPITVPATCVSATFDVWAGGGGGPAHGSAVGGGGSYARGTFSVPAGTTLTLKVGGGGPTTSAVRAYPTGGLAFGFNSGNGAGGGGGGSYVYQGSTILVAAGAGGGAGFLASSVTGPFTGFSGFAGDSASVQGMASGCGWGTSATTSGPGVNSASNGGQSLANGAAGSATQGGSGSGGGGYFGGGGGSICFPGATILAPGGGGSSFVNGAATGQSIIPASGGTAGNTAASNYASGVGMGGMATQAGGNGRIVVTFH